MRLSVLCFLQLQLTSINLLKVIQHKSNTWKMELTLNLFVLLYLLQNMSFLVILFPLF